MTIDRIAVIGSGTMGTGIAIAAAAAGKAVRLVDTNPDALARAAATAAGFFRRQVEKGRLTEADADAARARIVGGDFAAAGDADLVIEAVFEDLAVKRSVFAALGPHLGPATIVATNTSCLEVDALAGTLARPERFLGMHFFSPAEINPVVEVVRGARTDEATAAAALAFSRAIGKWPLACRDRPGFALNRFFCPYTNEAARLLDEGFGPPAAIDRAAVGGLGLALGPFAVMNIIKPRVALHAIENLAGLGPFYAAAASMRAAGDADAPWDLGDLGGDGGRLAPAEAETVAGRLRGAIFLPVLQALDERVADPADIDEGARLAFRFAELPCATMDALGREAVEALVAPLAARYGTPLPASLARVGRITRG